MNLSERAARHSALGDERRLKIVDELAFGDHTMAQLAELVGMGSNLLAHHLDVLEQAGLIERRDSEGDGRRRYVALRWDQLPGTIGSPVLPTGTIAFVCTHNSARSPFAAALWESLTHSPAASAGTHPAKTVNRTAVRTASEFGVDLSGATPSGYEALPNDIDVLISVCDRANETAVPHAERRLHWSIPDPVLVGSRTAFRSAFAEIAGRMGHLAGMAT